LATLIWRLENPTLKLESLSVRVTSVRRPRIKWLQDIGLARSG